MADEADKQQKTEEATPQRRREAREKGQVALSTEAVSAASLLAIAGYHEVLLHDAEGHGLVYDTARAVPVEGYSNFLWVVWLSLFERLGCDVAMAARWTSMAAPWPIECARNPPGRG